MLSVKFLSLNYNGAAIESSNQSSLVKIRVENQFRDESS